MCAVNQEFLVVVFLTPLSQMQLVIKGRLYQNREDLVLNILGPYIIRL